MRLFLGTINVILVALSRFGGYLSRLMSMARRDTDYLVLKSKHERLEVRPTLSFSDEDKARIIQLHDDALVVTLQIGGYDVRRVLVD